LQYIDQTKNLKAIEAV
jgi:hypothetical protein